MLKFIRGKGTQISAERVKLQKELFAFSKTVTHGFPSKPTALAYDPKLGLLAVANKTGALIVVGLPGVEFNGQHPQNEEVSVTKICFVPKSNRLITLCDDNSLHLWRLHDSNLKLIKSYPLEGKLKRISSIVIKDDCKLAYIGTEGGNIYMLDIPKFEITDKIIYLDVVLQNGPENYKVNPGAVECILELPEESQLLIGYERGLIVLWDIKEQKNIRNFLAAQQLEDMCWFPSDDNRDNTNLFATAHNDGSYIVWDIESGQKPSKEATTPYGPFPCKRIGKLRFWKDDDAADVYCAFSGGMPRRDYGDHFTVTVKAEGGSSDSDLPHVTFDLTSKVIDFVLVPGCNDANADGGCPAALIILAEEELIAVDLKSENWPLFYPHPYLNAIHPSAVTCFHHVDNVSDQAHAALKNIGLPGDYSKNPWPIRGGKLHDSEKLIQKSGGKGKDVSQKSVLITGHEDGSIRFWDVTGTCLALLTKFSTSSLFSASEDLPDSALDTSNSRDDDEDEWPPFRKVGTFDPYSDDPRLAVKKISYCPKLGVLVVGGTAGQLVVVSTMKRGILPEEPSKLSVITCNMVADKDGFVWKGHDPLDYKPKNNPNIGNREGDASFVINALLQIKPPAAVTALSLEASSGVTAVGTAHGVLVFDFFRKKVVMIKSTLNPNDVMAAGDTPISRRKSIKKSLRESFRRLRKGRSQRAPSGSSPIKSPSLATVQSPGDPPSKSVERAIEARGADDAMSSMVRSVTFAKTYIISLQTTTPTLWVGTNAGTVYVFTLAVPGGERRNKEDISCQIAKEIQLKHRAPVLSVIILDCNSGNVDGFSPQHDHLGPHKVIISSEEQLKIFTLPALRPFGKLKLTAQEGSRTRKVAVQNFVSTVDEAYHEKCLSCLTNQGDVFIITVPDLRKQIVFSQCLKREDITGISSFTFNETGEAFYQISSSQLQRISISTKATLDSKPKCSAVNLQQETNENESTMVVNANHVDAGHIDGDTNHNHREVSIDDLSSEAADITIDSVRDHTVNANSINGTTASRPVEERLIDGGSLTSPVSVTNQIRSVTTVTTTTVVNSLPTDQTQTESSAATNSSGASLSTTSTTTVVRSPVADTETSETPVVTSSS